ncbi:hypothetical protein [Nocardioides sp. T2.26MG-1]|uniref:hypothetical protein n=1 Tax=Nocardioides sp. T2.26MG-1 TaxID=3041166 RepID=UPI002541E3ED|nr:hypothetical protein [Nocardioides sp. T2.26MG-1]
MNLTTASTSSPICPERALLRLPGHQPGALSLTTLRRLALLGRITLRILQDPAVGDAWRAATGDIARAVEPTKQAASAVLLAGRVTATAWRRSQA